jgi:hypothetical protein
MWTLTSKILAGSTIFNNRFYVHRTLSFWGKRNRPANAILLLWIWGESDPSNISKFWKFLVEIFACPLHICSYNLMSLHVYIIKLSLDFVIPREGQSYYKILHFKPVCASYCMCIAAYCQNFTSSGSILMFYFILLYVHLPHSVLLLNIFD